MVGIERLDVARGLVDPAVEGRQVWDGDLGGSSRAGLVGQLPRHDRRVGGIGDTGDAVGPRDDRADVVAVHRLRLAVGVECRVPVGELGPGVRGVVHVDELSAVDPREIRHHPARPFPEVCQVDHAGHVALRHLGERPVETLQQILVVGRGLIAEPRRDRVLQRRQFGRAEDAEITDAERLQPIELARQACTVAIGGLGPEPRAVPDVRAGVAVGLAVAFEAVSGNGYERRCGRFAGKGSGSELRRIRTSGQQGHPRQQRRAPVDYRQSLLPVSPVYRGPIAFDPVRRDPRFASAPTLPQNMRASGAFEMRAIAMLWFHYAVAGDRSRIAMRRFVAGRGGRMDARP